MKETQTFLTRARNLTDTNPNVVERLRDSERRGDPIQFLRDRRARAWSPNAWTARASPSPCPIRHLPLAGSGAQPSPDPRPAGCRRPSLRSVLCSVPAAARRPPRAAPAGQLPKRSPTVCDGMTKTSRVGERECVRRLSTQSIQFKIKVRRRGRH